MADGAPKSACSLLNAHFGAAKTEIAFHLWKIKIDIILVHRILVYMIMRKYAGIGCNKRIDTLVLFTNVC